MKRNLREIRTVDGVPGSVVLVVLFATGQSAAVTNWRGGIVGGKTAVESDNSCSAGTWLILLPDGLNVDNGDNVYFDYRNYWWDNRSSGAPTATHYFKLSLDYLGNTYSSDDTEYTNGGNVNGRATFSRYIYNVQEYTYIFVNWTAKVSGPVHATCPAESHGPMQMLYLD